MRFLFPLFVILAAALHAAPAPKSGKASQPPSLKPSTGIDSAKIRKLYQDGDFEQAIALLESALKEKQVVTHRDSVLAFKHLGVMYAADDITRERGKYFMLQLLTIEPTARIMDMYASDMIYMIFKNIQEEYESSRDRFVRADKQLNGRKYASDAEPGEDPGGKPAKSEAKAGSSRGYLWMGAVVAMVGAGVAVYMLTDTETAPGTNHEVK
jgi:hypothetical protein